MLPKVEKRFHANYLRFVEGLGVSYEEFGELFTEEVHALPLDEQAIMHGFNWLVPSTITPDQSIVITGVFSRVIAKAKRLGGLKEQKPAR